MASAVHRSTSCLFILGVLSPKNSLHFGPLFRMSQPSSVPRVARLTKGTIACPGTPYGGRGLSRFGVWSLKWSSYLVSGAYVGIGFMAYSYPLEGGTDC